MIGIIAAMSCELEKLLAEAEIEEKRAVSGLTFYVGTLAGARVVMTVCGEGKVNAALCAEAMVLMYAPELLINTGVAGGLSPTLAVPDVAVASAVCEHDYDISPLGYSRGEVLFPGGSATYFEADRRFSDCVLRAAKELGVHAERGVIVSGDQFIADPDTKERLKSDFSGIACEMEGGSVGHVAFLNGTPFAVLRAISDNADDSTKFDPIRAAEISVKLTLRAIELYRM